ncbi:MAG: hypothetical protein V3U68_07110 [Bacteroidota bacterium]
MVTSLLLPWNLAGWGHCYAMGHPINSGCWHTMEFLAFLRKFPYFDGA